MPTTVIVPGSYPTGATLLIVGQAPGRTEAQKGRPFVGVDGLQLRAWLKVCALTPDALAYDNIHQEFNGDPTYKPTAKEMKIGYARIADTISTHTFTTVLLVGAVAAHMVFRGPMAQMNGRQTTLDGVHYIAVYHPGAFRNSLIHGGRGASQAMEAEILTTLRQVAAVVNGDVTGGVRLPEGKYATGPVYISKGCRVAVDVETHGETKDPRRAAFTLAAVAGDNTNLITFDPPVILPGATVEVHNAPYDGVVLNTWDCDFEDTKMLMHMGGEQDSTLKGWALRNLDHLMLSFGEAERLCVLPEYCLDDAQTTHRALPILKETLDNPILSLYEDLERPLLPLWTKMTIQGSFYLDHSRLTEYREELAGRVDRLLGEVQDMLPRGRAVKRCMVCDIKISPKGQRCEGGAHHRWEVVYLADEPVNLNSPVAQLLPALNELGIPATATGKGELEELVEEYPMLRTLLDYRKAHKELTTYINPWCESPEGERLGACWNPHGSWTLRVSSRLPNLMNIPPPLWDFFHAGSEHTLIRADHAQLEIRIAAHVSEDPAMIEACQSEDVHATFQEMLGLSDRRLSKVFVFGILYGGSLDGFQRAAQKAGVTLSEDTVRDAMKIVRSRFSRYFAWSRETSELRKVPGIFGMSYTVPPGEEHHRALEAVNAPIQGGGALVTKFGMLALHRAGYETVAQVHDEIVIRVRNEDAADAREDLVTIMETAIPHSLLVPLRVEVK